LDAKIEQFAGLLSGHQLPNEMLQLAAYHFFERIKLFSLFSKHAGFQEEREWKMVYMHWRDDTALLSHMCHYHISQRGVEPKFKFKIENVDGLLSESDTIDSWLSSITVGPTISSPLAVASIKRMIEKIGKKELADRVQASRIPFRAT
jgi:hypothetical protein